MKICFHEWEKIKKEVEEIDRRGGTRLVLRKIILRCIKWGKIERIENDRLDQYTPKGTRTSRFMLKYVFI